jgi:adenylate cyclase
MNLTAPDVLAGKILIVDDKLVNVLLLERMLAGAGYSNISSTTSPADVCRLHLEHRYDLILLDLQMPGTDGFEVMERLKQVEVGGYLPVLVITAQPAQKLRALKAGARDFVSKPFELAEVLVRVHNLLEVRLLQAETERLYEQVVAEQKVSERLLLNVLPRAIAERLKGRPENAEIRAEVIADNHAEVTVLFADIVGFTSFSAGVSASSLVEVLNDLFTRFDGIAARHGLEKIKTIGDAYMAAAGLPEPSRDHAVNAAHTALEMIETVERFNEQSSHRLNVRIGMDSGAVVAGVIGQSKFFYDLWGDVVNTASRMESQGVAGRIQMTESTRQRLSETFELERRGAIDVKGKGEMQTWFLNGRSALAEAVH